MSSHIIAKRLSARRSSLASAAVCDTSPAWPPDVIVKGGEIWGIWWPTVLLNDLRTVCVHPLLRATCRVCWSAILLENEPGWHQLLAVLDKLNFHSLYEYARIIAFAPHPCSRSVCIRILSACDTFPILTALTKCWLLTAILPKYRVLYLHIRLPDEFASLQPGLLI